MTRRITLLVISLLMGAVLMAVVLDAGCATQASTGGSGPPFTVSSVVRQAARAWHDQIGRTPGQALGILSIPQISLELTILEGTDQTILDTGPGHWEETPLPGEGGRCVISGHRTSCGAPFERLNELRRGDRIEMRMPYGTFEYEVVETVIVEPDQVQVVRQRGLEELSLATCHPLYSAEFRLVVQARAVGYRPGA